MRTARNTGKNLRALALIMVFAFGSVSVNAQTHYVQSVLHEIGGWTDISKLVGPPDGQYAYTANATTGPWAWENGSTGAAVWLDFGQIMHSGTIVVYHNDPGGHRTDLVVGRWYMGCSGVPHPEPLASDWAGRLANVQGTGTVTCYNVAVDFRYVRLDHFTLDTSLQDGIDAVAVIEGEPADMGVKLDPAPPTNGSPVYAASQSNNSYWSNPAAILGAPDSSYAWSNNPSHTMPYIVADLGRVVYSGTIVLHHNKEAPEQTALTLSINSEEYDPDQETCPPWPSAAGWEALWIGNVNAGSNVVTLQFPPTHFRYIVFGQSQCHPGQDDGIDAVGVYESPTNQPPVANAGADQIIECACQQGGTKATLDGSGSTDPDGDPLTYTWSGPFADSPVHGSSPTVALTPGCLGSYVITLVVNDGHQDSSSDTMQVTVRDTTPPDLTCPASIRVEARTASGTPATDPVIAAFLAGASATDNCDPNPVVSNDAPTQFPMGETKVTFKATDRSSNVSTGEANVKVQDTTPPVIRRVSACPDTLWPPNHQMVTVTVKVEAKDLCDPTPKSRIVNVTCNEPVNGPGHCYTQPDWEITGDLTVMLRAEHSGLHEQRIYTIHVECKDASGSIATSDVAVTVQHDQGRKKWWSFPTWVHPDQCHDSP